MAGERVGRKLRLGVVGGTMGAAFCWHEHPDCTVTAVAELNHERRALLMETYRCQTSYKSLDEVLKDPNVDAVAAFTGVPNHAKHAIEALKRGKHVIVGAPACVGSLEEAQSLLETVKTTGLTYMMAEPAYYQGPVISARRFFSEGRFGELFSCDAEYVPADARDYVEDPYNWRHGMPPMYVATPATCLLAGVSGERLAEVSCVGWGEKSEEFQDNPYKNPFMTEAAQFKTDRGHAFRVRVWLKGGAEGTRIEWYGTRMSFLQSGRRILRSSKQTERDAGGFLRELPRDERYQPPEWFKTDLLPEPLRHPTPYGNAMGFLTHEFVEAVTKGRRPAIDVYEALAYTVPGIVAHQSALKDGELIKVPNFERPA